MRHSWTLLVGIGLGIVGTGGAARAACPDGILDATEECDDGNTQPGDGCSASCQIEPWILQVCSTGRDGSPAIAAATTLNTYFAAPAAQSMLAAGTRVLALGAQAGANVPVRAGDRLMVIQMQGAQINAGAAIRRSAVATDWSGAQASGSPRRGS